MNRPSTVDLMEALHLFQQLRREDQQKVMSFLREGGES